MERSLAQPHTERAGAPQPASTGTKPWGAPRTQHRQGGGGGGGGRETGATTHSMGAGGQGTARKAVDPDVPDSGEGAERERARAARASPSARGTCDIQRVTQPLPPVACSLGGPGLAPGHRGSNQPTNRPAASGIPTASGRGAKSEVAHKWARWIHHPCRLGDPHGCRAGGKIISGP